MQRFFSILSDGVRRFEGTVDKFTGDGIMAAVRRPDRPRGPRPARLLRGPADLDELVSEYAAELRRAQGAQLLGPDRDQLGRGGRRRDRRGRRAELHRGRPHGRPGAADGGAGRARQGLPDRAHGEARRAATSSWRTSASSRSRGRAGRSGSSSWSASGAARSRLDLSRERGFSRFVGRDDEMAVLEEALERAKARRGRRGRRSSPSRASARAASATSSPSAAARAGIEVYEAQAQAHGQAIPFMPVLQMLRAYFGIEDARLRADRPREDRRPAAAARSRLRRRPAARSSTSSACPTPSARAPAQRRGAPAGAARASICRLVPGARARRRRSST